MAGRHKPCKPVSAVGRKRSAWSTHPEGQPLSPPPGVRLNSSISFRTHALKRWALSPEEVERVDLYGVLSLGWTDRWQDPPIGWLGHPLPLHQIGDAGWQCGQGSRGGGSISLSLSASAVCVCVEGGTETRGPCGIHGHHARFPLLIYATLQSWRPKGLPQRTPGAARGDSLPPESSLNFYTSPVPVLGFGPTCLGLLTFALKALSPVLFLTNHRGKDTHIEGAKKREERGGEEG